MANYKGHVAGGTLFGGIFYAVIAYLPIQRLAETAGLLQNWQAIFAIFVIAILFGLFPDVDTNSKAQITLCDCISSKYCSACDR